jgi:hypothetical protein
VHSLQIFSTLYRSWYFGKIVKVIEVLEVVYPSHLSGSLARQVVIALVESDEVEVATECFFASE